MFFIVIPREANFKGLFLEISMPDRRGRRALDQPTIEVITTDDTYQRVSPYVLDILLENNKVKMFGRSSGRVIVGVDPIRVKDRREATLPFNGPDRRSFCFGKRPFW